MKANKILNFLTLLVVIFICGATVYILNTFYELKKDQEMVKHTQDVQNEIQEVISASYQIENAIRFNEIDMKDYRLFFQSGKSDYNNAKENLSKLIVDNREQMENFNELVTIMDSRIKEIETSDNFGMDSTENRDYKIKLIQKSHFVLRDVRRISKVMINKEDDLFLIRQNIFLDSFQKSIFIIIIFIFVITAVLIWAYFIIKNEFRINSENNESQLEAFENLRQSEQRFKMLYDSISDVVLNLDSDNKILTWNKAGVNLLGYKSDEIVGENFEFLLSDSIKEDLEDYLYEKNVIHDVFINTKDGREIPMELVSFEWVVADKEYIGISLRDNGERYRQNKLIKDLGSRFDLVLKSANFGVWDWEDMSKDDQWWSNTLYDLIGYSEEELPASRTNFNAIINPEDQKGIREILDKTEGSAPFKLEYRINTKHDGDKWFRAIGEIGENNMNGTQRMMGIIYDISDEKSQKLKLEEVNKRFTLTTESANIGSWDWYNISEDRIWFSDVVLKLLGYTKDEFKFSLKGFFALIHPDDTENVQEAIELNHNQNVIYKMDYRVLTKNQGYMWVRAIGDSVVEESTGHKRMIGVIYNIEEELRQRRAIEESNKQLEQFAYIASHDLREPLRKIKAFGERLDLQIKNNDTEQSLEYITRMRNAAQRMENLIDDLLSFSRISSPKTEREDVSLHEMATNVMSELEIMMQRRKAQVNLGELPVLKDAIPSQIFQLFQNLISNSIKFSREGVDPIINISGAVKTGFEMSEIIPNIDASTNYYLLKFEDNGIGFDQQYAEQIFTIFQRLNNRSSFEGTGIGLAICKKIVENHEGEIKAVSKEGMGAQFYIALPFKNIILD